MTLSRKLLAAILLICLSSLHLCAQRTEKFRPQYHFSPNSGWIGDPDGLVRYQSLYHLFWWGHATSSDMVYWDELPYPIQGDQGAYGVTTGSSVIDKNNTSGQGANSFVNVQTLFNGAAGVGLSTSLDGSTKYADFNLYPGNPVLNPPPSSNGFRDPQVFWYTSNNSSPSGWVMVIAGGNDEKVYFYRSGNLINWTPAGSFSIGDLTNNSCGADIWETPDLFQLPLDGSSSNLKWVLSIGVRNRMCYVVGNFDGNNFTDPGDMLLTDAGPDFYSARTWRDYDNPPQSRVTMLGWMGNWTYSTVSPSRPVYGGTGAVSIPRDLSLRTYPEGVRLVQTPISALTSELEHSAKSVTAVQVTGTHPITDFVSFQPVQNSYEINATFAITSSATFGFNLLVDHASGRILTIQYDPSSHTLSADRTHSFKATGNSQFDSNFPAVISATVYPDSNNQLTLHMFIDKSSLEIFTNDGRVVITLLTYPEDPQPGIEVFSNNGSTTLASFTGWDLSSIWAGKPTNTIQSGGIYKIKNRHDDNNGNPDGKVLDDPQAGNTHVLQQWTDLGGANQQWKVDLVQAGSYEGNKWIPPYYRFTNQGSTANQDAIDLRDGSTSNGGVVQEYSQVANDTNQQWQIEEIGGDYFKIASPNSQAIEVESTPSGEATNDGQPLQTWQFLAFHHQEWQFILVTPPH